MMTASFRATATAARLKPSRSRSLSPQDFNVVGEFFVGAAMPFILGRICKKVAVELTDMVLSERDCVVNTEDCLHHFRVAGNLLFVARRKGPQANVCKQPFDLSIGEARSFDTCGGTDTLNCRDAPEAG